MARYMATSNLLTARTEFASALNQICTERGITPDSVLETIKTAILAAYRKDFGIDEEIEYEDELDSATGAAKIYKIDAKKAKKKKTKTATQKKPVFISIIAIFAVVNGALIQLIMASRVIYGMASHGWITKFFCAVNPNTNTPIRATVLVTLGMTFAALLLPIVTLAEFTSFLLLVVFSLVNLALIQIKRKDPCPEGVKVYPRWVPYLGFFASATFLMGQVLLK